MTFVPPVSVRDAIVQTLLAQQHYYGTEYEQAVAANKNAVELLDAIGEAFRTEAERLRRMA